MLRIEVSVNFDCNILSNNDVDSMLLDGRFCSSFATTCFKNIIEDISINDIDKKSYDAILNEKKAELKGLTKYGLKTCPSSMIGKGRRYNKEEHMKVIESNGYYVIHEYKNFKLYYYVLCSSQRLCFQSKTYKDAVEFLKDETKKELIYEGNKMNIGELEKIIKGGE